MAAILTELRARGVRNHYTLAYQSRVGPVEWLKPYTDESIRCIFASSRAESLVTVWKVHEGAF